MNRKLRNSLAGLATSAALLALGLVAANPGAPAPDTFGYPTASVRHASTGDLDPAAQARLQASGARAAATSADALDMKPKEGATARPAHRRLRAHRQTLVMPYFSFAPRG